MVRAIDRGLSLTEVIISLSLLGLVAIAILNLFPSAMLTVHQSEKNAKAHTLGADLIEEARSRHFEALVIGEDGDPAVLIIDEVPYTYRTEIFSVGQDDVLKGIRVTVQWPGRARQLELTREIEVARVRR